MKLSTCPGPSENCESLPGAIAIPVMLHESLPMFLTATEAATEASMWTCPKLTEAGKTVSTQFDWIRCSCGTSTLPLPPAAVEPSVMSCPPIPPLSPNEMLPPVEVPYGTRPPVDPPYAADGPGLETSDIPPPAPALLDWLEPPGREVSESPHMLSREEQNKPAKALNDLSS